MKQERHCLHCGKAFVTDVCPSRLNHGKYCSKACSHEGKKRQVGRTCLQCGKEFTMSPSHGRGKYCSHPCWWTARRNPGTKQRRRANPKFRVSDNVSGAMRKSIAERKAGRHWEDLVGYTLDDLMNHLESQFTKGMVWENYGNGGWHIDHIRPVSDFNFSSPEDPEFVACWSLWNLQPLWARDNFSKRDKCPAPPLPLVS